MMRRKRNPDLLARVLSSAGQFRGKARLADLLGRLTSSWTGGRGTYSVTSGETATIDLGDRIQRLMWGAAYEPNVKRCLAALLRPGDTFVDVGAHIGFFSLIASSLVGSHGKVYAFEADATLFQTLYSNALEYPWLVASLRAVWNKSGSVAFSNPQQAGESGWGKLASVRNEGHIASVEAVSLDEWHESVGSPPIRLIKIDAEGSEPFILEGARRIIASTRPFLIIELNDQLLREVGQTRAIVADTLRDQGYRTFTIGLKDLSESWDLIEPFSSEILCVPSDRLEQTKCVLPRLRIKHWSGGQPDNTLPIILSGHLKSQIVGSRSRREIK
jgi:FkbM family methyltransferase